MGTANTSSANEFGNYLYGYYDSLARVAGDPELRGRMHADPAGVLREQGINVLPGLDLRVVETSPEVLYFVLPPNPNASLSDSSLEDVAGGTGTAQSAQSVGLMSASSLW